MDVVALGELLIDFTCLDADQDGYPTLRAYPGGAPANFLSVLSRFGAKTAMLGKVGEDTFGRALLTTLKKNGIETSGMIVDSSVFTTLAFVTLDETGDRDFSFSRKPGADTRLTCQELNLSLIDAAKVFHFGSLPMTDEPARSATKYAVEYAKKQGKWITYDPNLRKPLWNDLETAREQILWGLSKADVVKISDEEVGFLFGSDPQNGAEEILRRFDVKLVFVTCGAGGCYYKHASASGYVPALSDIQVVDTTGAGDIFGGSVIWKLLQFGKPLEALTDIQLRDAVSFACTAAGLSVTKPGGISSVPDYRDVLEQQSVLSECGYFN
ncbi:MAG: carbohydrate kinase [Oscillospiraceae bacterium]|nr:carbohydrate kinase [Oscillospiraceae bacterium]